MPRPTIAELVVGDEPSSWQRLGFAIDDGRTTIGTTTVVLDGGGGGLRSWALRDAPATKIDGLETRAADGATREPGAHPNGAVRIDHVVVNTPDLQRTFAALQSAGLDLRRVREHSDTLHQGFFRLGEVILEVVENPQAEGPARFWGITLAVADIDRCAELMGEKLGEVHDAVQPGRRIATVRREAGLGVPVALITT